MDVRQYYRKLREVEAGISDPFVLVSSLETADGGKAGIINEVTREQAAKGIVESRVRLSTEAEQKAYLAKRTADRKAYDKAETARRVQVTIVQKDEAETSEEETTAPEKSSRK